MFLDIDRKAQADMMLLAHAGVVGRTSANYLMWQMLSDWALNTTHQDLSRKVSSNVKWQRRNFDRPPANHNDLWNFKWKNLDDPLPHMKKWSPLEVPRGTCTSRRTLMACLCHLQNAGQGNLGIKSLQDIMPNCLKDLTL